MHGTETTLGYDFKFSCVERCATTHLKASDPLYKLPVVIFTWRNLGKVVCVPWSLVNVQMLFGYKSVAKYSN